MYAWLITCPWRRMVQTILYPADNYIGLLGTMFVHGEERAALGRVAR